MGKIIVVSSQGERWRRGRLWYRFKTPLCILSLIRYLPKDNRIAIGHSRQLEDLTTVFGLNLVRTTNNRRNGPTARIRSSENPLAVDIEIELGLCTLDGGLVSSNDKDLPSLLLAAVSMPAVGDFGLLIVIQDLTLILIVSDQAFWRL